MEDYWRRCFRAGFYGLLSLALLFFLGACGGGGGSSSTTSSSSSSSSDSSSDSSSSSSNAYSGSASISGKISLSSLGSSDQQQLSKLAGVSGKPYNKASLSAVRQATATTNAIVKLYVIGSTGDLEDTGLSCSFTGTADENGNPDYQCDGVKDDVNYVVKYIKIVSGNKAIEMKADVKVAAGATTVAAGEVSPQTTVVLDAVVNAILTATAGTDIDQTVVDSIITSVKTAIVTLVSSGVIQIPTMTVEAPKDADGAYISDATTLATATKVTYKENADVTTATGQIISNSDIDSSLAVIKVETQTTKFAAADLTTEAGKRAFITRVFKEMIDDDGEVPEFFVNFFADAYVAGKTKTVAELMDATIAGFEWREGESASTYGLTKSDAIAAFVQELTDVYALLDKKAAGTELTAEEKEDLADIPPVILGLFPHKDKATWSAMSASTVLNVPQGIALVVYVADVYVQDAVDNLVGSTVTATADDSGNVAVGKEHYFEFDPMMPGSIMDLFGFFQNYQDYAGLDIFELWIHPGKAWIESFDANGNPNGGSEVDMLNGGTCFGDVASMVAAMNNDTANVVDYSDATVTLTYPKTGGTTGTVNLVRESWHGGDDMGDTCFALDPWMQGVLALYPDFNFETDQWPNEYIQPSPVISDFTSGTYTITLNHSSLSEPMTKSFTKKVITGMSKARPKLTEPRSMPEWPGQTATQAEMDKFNAAMEAYNKQGPTIYSANVNSAGVAATGVAATHAKITAKWTAPVVTLPEGVKIGYQLDLGYGGCDNNGCNWEHVYATWDRDKTLYGTSFTIPVPLLKSADRRYEMHISTVFIDSVNGSHLGQGGSTRAEFYVSDPIDKNATFTIAGKADPDYKVALVKESWDSTTNMNKRTVLVESTVDATTKAYSLKPRIGQFLDATNAWFNIIAYQDTNTAITGFDDMDMQMWPENGQNLWFDAWGGILRAGRDVCETDADGNTLWNTCQHSEQTIRGGETVSGPSWVALDKTLTFTLNGTALDGFSVAIIKNYWDDASTDPYKEVAVIEAAVSAGTYSLTPTIGDFFDATVKDPWYSIVLFEDTNSSGGFDKNDSRWWPNTNFWIDTWGGKLRIGKEKCSKLADGSTDWNSCTYTETEITGDETVTGPSFLSLASEIATATGGTVTFTTQPVELVEVRDVNGNPMSAISSSEYGDYFQYEGASSSITLSGASNIDKTISWYQQTANGSFSGFGDYSADNGVFSITLPLETGMNYIDLCDYGPYCIKVEFNNTDGSGIAGASKAVEITSPAHQATAEGTVTVTGIIDPGFTAQQIYAVVYDYELGTSEHFSSDTNAQTIYGDSPLTFDGGAGTFSFDASVVSGNTTEIRVDAVDTSGNNWHGHGLFVNSTTYEQTSYKPGQLSVVKAGSAEKSSRHEIRKRIISERSGQ